MNYDGYEYKRRWWAIAIRMLLLGLPWLFVTITLFLFTHFERFLIWAADRLPEPQVLVKSGAFSETSNIDDEDFWNAS